MDSNKITRIFNYILIIAFGMLISLPLIFFNRIEGKISVVENKTLALKPELILADGKINPNYISEYESYFNDNIGFKEEALTANIIMKYKLFHVIDIPNWLVGKEEHLFYTSGGEDIKTYCGTNAYTESKMQNMADNLYSMNEYFKQEGCLTYNMFIPNKEAVYSELYNPYIYHKSESRQDIFCKFLTDKYAMNVINIKDALIKNKDKQLYYKSCDASHWNMNGAYIGYLSLMKEIKKDIPDIKILQEDDFEISEEKYVGLMQYYTNIDIIHNSFDLEDVIYTYNLKSGYKAKMVGNSLQEIEIEIDPNLNFFHYYNEETENKKDLFIVGDSYIYVFMLPMLAESFENVYFIRNTEADTIVEIAKTVEPDVFVFEVVERVFSEDYFAVMGNYSKYLNYDIDLSEYSVIEMTPEIHIDYPVVKNNSINRTDISQISGWALDIKNDTVPKEVLVEIDGKYRKAKTIYRDDLAEVNEKYGYCGFDISIDDKILMNAEKISFYVITENNEVYQPCLIYLE